MRRFDGLEEFWGVGGRGKWGSVRYGMIGWMAWEGGRGKGKEGRWYV
jgi:hypothetical protein